VTAITFWSFCEPTLAGWRSSERQRVNRRGHDNVEAAFVVFIAALLPGMLPSLYCSTTSQLWRSAICRNSRSR